MSSRAHHPAERDAAESPSDGVRAPGSSPRSGESGVTGVDEAVSREVRLPALVEPPQPDDAAVLDRDAAGVPNAESTADPSSTGDDAAGEHFTVLSAPAGSVGTDEDDDDAEEVVPEPDSLPPLAAELDAPNTVTEEEAKAVSSGVSFVSA